jgi:hypothetical protein
MNSGLDAGDRIVVAAFRAALVHQGLIVLLVFLALAAGWAGLRTVAPGRFERHNFLTSPGLAEPPGRQFLVIAFGNLWLFDAILQAQPRMAVDLPAQTIEPAAASSPLWVQHLVNWAATAWSYHPVQTAAAAVWIQAGLALWLLVTPRGTMSRLAGIASVGWGLVVWVFGESFGGIFAPGLSWLTGAPGSVAVYIVAGLVIALPDRAWRSPRLGRLVLGGLGVFLLGMAVLQAWPGRGFWQGLAHGRMGTLAAMTRTMAVTPQPAFLSTWVSGFTNLDEAHGFAVNLFVVAALALIGAGFASALSGSHSPRVIRFALAGFAALCLADWVLVQDLGFLGGVGTDPNSMIPFVLLAAGGWLALTRVPAALPAPAAPAPGRRPVAAPGLRSLLAAASVGVIVLGAVPMVIAVIAGRG